MDQSGGLCESQLLYLFLDVSSLPRHRTFFEETLRMPVVENQFQPPHHHHGLVKYDAGDIILSLNLFGPGKFSSQKSDGLTVICAPVEPHGSSVNGPGVFSDWDGHHYVLPDPDTAGHTSATAIQELRFTVDDIRASIRMYGEVLGLRLVERTSTTARFATGTIDIVLQESTLAPDGLPIRRSAYLPVFYAADVVAMHAELQRRGLEFSQDVGFSDIGGTARFLDNSGNTFCLYQPSAESLEWGSGEKVKELVRIPRSPSLKGAVPC